MSKYDAVLWDLDRTLLDFDASESVALKKCFDKFGLGECTDEMVHQYSVINMKYWEALERGEMSKPEILVGRFREFLTVCGKDGNIAAGLNESYQLTLGDTVAFMPGAWEVVSALKGKILQVCISNGTVIAQNKKLRNSGLDKVFDAVFLSEEVGYEKPFPAFFDKVCTDMGLSDRKKLLVVGDSLTSDIKGAIDSGLPSCWYNPAHMENKRGIVADMEIASLWEIPKIVL